MRAFATGVRVLVARTIDRFFVRPARQRQWEIRSSPFEHQSKDGLRWTLDPTQYVDSYIYLDGVYERRFLELIHQRFDAGAVALDIGANIGNHAIFLARSFATIHAFEPNPEMVRRLTANIALNALEGRIVVHPIGLGKRSETLAFAEHRAGNFGASHFLKTGEQPGPGEEMLRLPIAAADAFLGALGLKRLDFIKIDVEGWEPPLFEGLRETIARFRPVIAFEFHGQAAADDDFERIRSVLPGYIICEPRHAPADASLWFKTAWNWRRRGQAELTAIDQPEPRTYENLLAFPDQATLDRFSTPNKLR